ncbi:MAG: ATP-binding protein [Chloroflexaceae bacterium]|nr:ATP-binding protein [Chloroflexaceae bacterium]NJO04818.1 ATP-binding protein [Chloroflexaceae bacterium]
MERALGNLLTNAIKYSSNEHAVIVTISEEIQDDVPWALVMVQDQGIGIPATELSYIFEPFRRASNGVSKASGTGLGLASAQHFIEQHGGRITVESQEGIGSTFTIWLPMSPEGS